MKHAPKCLSLLLACLLLSGLLSGCGKKDTKTVTCPFTELTWNSTVDDMLALEGEDYETYDSVYQGTTYTYSKEYQDLKGTIKYMYDDQKALMCVAWTYSSDTDSSLQELYDSIHKQVTDTYGESGYEADASTNYGDVWYLEGGHIILSVMSTSDQKALQYSYQNPVLNEDEEGTDTTE